MRINLHLLLCCLLAGGGCSSIRTAHLKRNEERCGSDTRHLHGIPVTLGVPHQFRVQVMERYYVKVGTDNSEVLVHEVVDKEKNLHTPLRTRYVKLDVEYKKEIFTVDAIKPAGTLTTNVDLTPETRNFKQINNNISDTTMQSITNALNIVAGAIQEPKNLPPGTPAGLTAIADTSIKPFERTLAVGVFDVNDAHIKDKIQAFLCTHLKRSAAPSSSPRSPLDGNIMRTPEIPPLPKVDEKRPELEETSARPATAPKATGTPRSLVVPPPKTAGEPGALELVSPPSAVPPKTSEFIKPSVVTPASLPIVPIDKAPFPALPQSPASVAPSTVAPVSLPTVPIEKGSFPALPKTLESVAPSLVAPASLPPLPVEKAPEIVKPSIPSLPELNVLPAPPPVPAIPKTPDSVKPGAVAPASLPAPAKAKAPATVRPSLPSLPEISIQPAPFPVPVPIPGMELPPISGVPAPTPERIEPAPKE